MDCLILDMANLLPSISFEGVDFIQMYTEYSLHRVGYIEIHFILYSTNALGHHVSVVCREGHSCSCLSLRAHGCIWLCVHMIMWSAYEFVCVWYDGDHWVWCTGPCYSGYRNIIRRRNLMCTWHAKLEIYILCPWLVICIASRPCAALLKSNHLTQTHPPVE